jgi:formylglycine-generating enzyme required for sulfatase activity
MDDSNQQVQIRTKDGKAHTGILMNDRLGFQTNYSEKHSIPTNRITSVVVSPVTLDGRADLSHRWQTAPDDFFQDKFFGNGSAPEMVALIAGKYLRGDATGDTDERPPVSVSLGAFAIGIFEVTFAEYDRFCTDIRKDCPDDEGWGRGRRPVVNVSWNDAVAYTQWLSRKTRKNFRLPTDAEWEYASRAGSLTTYWWGDDAGLANANCEGCGSPWDGDKSALVGRFPANAFGLHDTAGNVFEWAADCWHDSFAEAPSNGAAIEKPDCGKRVIRGGAWSFPAKEIRSANRWRDFPTRRSDDTGFRVARDL